MKEMPHEINIKYIRADVAKEWLDALRYLIELAEDDEYSINGTFSAALVCQVASDAIKNYDRPL